MMTDDLKDDVRVLSHLKRRGELDEDNLDKHLATIPDDAANGESTTTRFISSARTSDRNNG